MEPNKRTTEKILMQALELHEKGFSLHWIVRTYPNYKNEIEELFSSLALVSQKKPSIDVSEMGLERILSSLPEKEVANLMPVKSPFSKFWTTVHGIEWKFLVPAMALALIAGGLFFVTRHTQSSSVHTLASTEQPIQSAKINPSNPTDTYIAMLSADSSQESNSIMTSTDQNTAVSDSRFMIDPTQSHAN